MNAILNIQVRVASQQANAALAGLGSGIANVNKSAATANGLNSFGKQLDVVSGHMVRAGKNMQWVGRQISYAFTIPLGIAGGYATKFALENERAFTQLRKVYGLLGSEGVNVNKELTSLAKTFELLSVQFGVQQSQVIDVAKAWAEAGSSGVGLARAVKNTLEASIVGSIDLTKATEGLIAVQSAYKLSTTQLRRELANLDLIQVQSGISFEGLITVIQRAGSTAAVAGVDIRHLSAMAASIVPAAGTASQAGNALRTILSRLVVPTRDAVDVLGQMGIDVTKAGWSTLTAAQRFELLAKEISKLPDSKKLIVDTYVAARFQLNRFSALIEDAAKSDGFYRRSLENTADSVKAMALYQQQLSTVLSSNPQKLKIMGVALQNALAKVIIPLLPAILGVVNSFVKLAEAFQRLSPETQKLVLFGLLFLALLGPLIRYVGAFMQLFGVLGRTMAFVGAQMAATGRIGLAVSSAMVTAWNGVAMALWRLAGVADLAWVALTRALAPVILNIKMAWYGAVYAATAAWQSFTTAVATAWRTLPVLVGIVGQGITLAWRAAMQAVLAASVWVSTAIPAAMTAASNAVLAVSVWISTAIPAAMQAASNASIRIWLWFTNTLPVILRTIPILVATVGQGIVLAWTAVTQALSTLWLMTSVRISLSWQAAMLAIQRATWMTAFRLGAIWTGVGHAIVAAFTWVTTVLPVLISTLPVTMAAAGSAMVTIAGATGSGIASAFAAGFAAVASLPVTTLVAIAAAIVLIVVALTTSLGGYFADLWNGIVRTAAQLPRQMASIFGAVVKVIAMAMEKIIDWLSYLNPFARHSPSLVDVVKAGTTVVTDQYKGMADRVVQVKQRAGGALAGFQQATGGSAEGFDRSLLAGKAAKVTSIIPSAAPQVKALVESIVSMKAVLRDLEPLIKSQSDVVAVWESKLNVANLQLEVAQDRLDALTQAAESAKNALDDASAVLARLAETPIQGMKAMSDQIFANEMAQKRLRLEILEMAQAGQSIEDINSKMAALQGTIEMLRSEQAGLRAAGAGSEILGPIQAEIDAMIQAQQELAQQGVPLNDLQDQLKALELEGQRLDLVNSLQFDPLRRQIEDVTNTMVEMPFDQLLANIQAQQGTVNQLQLAYDAANAAVTQQQAVVDQAKAARDQLQTSYDAEKQKLDALQQSYDEINGAVNDATQAMDQFVSAAEAAKSAGGKESLASQLFNAPAADYPDVTGTGGIGREMGDIDAFNAELQKSLEGIGEDFGKLDIFAPIKNMFKGAWEWIKNNAKRIIIGALIAVAFIALEVLTGGFGLVLVALAELLLVGLYALFGDDLFKTIGSAFMSVMGAIWSFLKAIWAPLKAVFMGIFAAIGAALSFVWNSVILPIWSLMGAIISGIIIPIFQFLGSVIGTVFAAVSTAIGAAWEFISPIFDAIVGFITGYIVPIFQLFGAIVEIVVVLIGRLIGWLWTNVISPAFRAIVDAITSGPGAWFLWLWENVIKPVIGAIAAIILWAWNNVISPAFTALSGFISTVLGPVFSWLYNNIVKPAMDSIGAIIGFIWDKVIRPVFDGFVWFIKEVLAPVFSWLWHNIIEPAMNGISSVFTTVWGGIKNTLKTVANFFIDAFNTIAGAIQSVADFLNIDVNITKMDRIGDDGGGVSRGSSGNGVYGLAQGGIIPRTPVGDGMIVNRARAIVGEGGPHPEYVIPTDPRYRNRASSLYDQLGKALGVGDQQGGLGWHSVGDAWNAAAGKVKKGAVWAATAAPRALMDAAISLIPAGFFKDMANGVRNKVMDFIQGISDKGNSLGSGLHTGTLGSAQGPLVDWMRQSGVPFVTTSTSGGRHATGSYHYLGRAADFAPPMGGADNPGLLAINKAFQSVSSDLAELIYAGPGHIPNIKDGKSFKYSASILADHHDHVHAALFNGGLVRGSMKGTLVRVGERNQDEAVVPLPNGLRSANMGTKTYNFNGDLSFPNVRSGEDAEAFIRNLEALVGD